jgi:hypothetical protein
MIINETDHLYYNNAVEYVVEQLEITRNFIKYNGLTSFTSEEVSKLAITHVKEWLTSKQGEHWLATLGYSRLNTITTSGSIITLADYCPVCSGIYPQTDGTVCECCGRSICRPCSTVVDPRYDVEWCESCVQREALTNILSHNE